MEILSLKDMIFSIFNDYSKVIDFGKNCDNFFVRYLGKDTIFSLSTDYKNGVYIVCFDHDNCHYTFEYAEDTKLLTAISFSIYYD